MTIGSRHNTAFSTIATAQLRGSSWPDLLAFVLGLLVPVLVWCATIGISLLGFSELPHGHGGLSSGVKKLTTQPLLLACRVAQLGSRWCEESRGVSTQERGRSERGDGVFIRKIIFLIHGWMMYHYQINQIQAQKVYQRVIK